nr:CAP domain-containing protein [Planctomycetota bacterium]
GSGGGAPPAPGSGDVMSAAEEQYALEVLVLSNQERQQAGVPALAYDQPASQVAYDHCLFQQAQGFISHEGPGGNAPWDRLTDAGISWRTAGENVAVGQPTPAAVVQAWVNSPGHYANMVNGAFTNLGMGVQEGAGGVYSGPWWTQLFYTP